MGFWTKTRNRRPGGAVRFPRDLTRGDSHSTDQRLGFSALSPTRNDHISASSRSGSSKESFSTFGLHKKLLRAIDEAGFDSPRPIQAKTIPAVLRGKDVLGLAQTGTGKTAAFALPILQGLLEDPGGGTRVLVIAPTRELALQIQAETQLLGKYTGVRSVTIFGGVGARNQIRSLRSRPEIIVACPGRLLDLYSSGDVDLEGIDTLVLDEVDHMFDMGFLPDIRRILRALPENRQNLFFSATMPKDIRRLADGVLYEPHTVELGHSAPAETIDHFLYPVAQNDKTELLLHVLDDRDFDSAIIFLRTKHRTRRLAQVLDRDGFNAIALQGNMSQNQRQRAMDGFRQGKYRVLVATDIASRGIDVQDVSLVVNFDVPNTPDAYTHRIGRTGRAERSGEALTFVTPDDFAAVKDIEKKLGVAIPRRKVEGFEVPDMADRRKSNSPGSSGGSGGRGGSRRRGGSGRRGGGRGGGRGGPRGRGRRGATRARRSRRGGA